MLCSTYFHLHCLFSHQLLDNVFIQRHTLPLHQAVSTHAANRGSRCGARRVSIHAANQPRGEPATTLGVTPASTVSIHAANQPRGEPTMALRICANRVSIHAANQPRGEPVSMAARQAAIDVSIHAANQPRGEHQAVDGIGSSWWFQSTPRISLAANLSAPQVFSARGCFNPRREPASRRTSGGGWYWKFMVVSIHAANQPRGEQPRG